MFFNIHKTTRRETARPESNDIVGWVRKHLKRLFARRVDADRRGRARFGRARASPKSFWKRNGVRRDACGLSRNICVNLPRCARLCSTWRRSGG